METKYKIIAVIASVVLAILTISLLKNSFSKEDKDSTKTMKKTKLTLGSANLKGEFADSELSILNKVSHYAFCSLQEVRIRQSEWDTPKIGEAQIFKPVINRHPFLLVMVPNVEAMESNIEVFSTYGVYINPNSGFQYNNYSIHKMRGKEEKGIILVFGKFGDNDFVFGGVHGDWDLENGGYDNKVNIDAITPALEEIARKKPKYYVIMGDFNIKYSVMEEYLNKRWRKILPDITLEDGPNFTCFDDDGFANPDHILTNIPYTNLNFFFMGGDHMQFSMDIEIDQFKKRLSNLISLDENA